MHRTENAASFMGGIARLGGKPFDVQAYGRAAHNSRNDLTLKIYKDRIRSTETNARLLQEFLLNVNGHGTPEVADDEESV